MPRTRDLHSSGCQQASDRSSERQREREMAIQTWSLPSDCIHFVDSVHSEEFALFLLAMESACVVAMDAEWKPLNSNNTRTFPRVSIMQLACRIPTHNVASSNNEAAAFTTDCDDSSSSQNLHKEDVDEEPQQLDNVVSVEDTTLFVEPASLNDEVPTLELGYEAQGSTINSNHIVRAAVVIGTEPQTSGLVSKEGEKCMELSLSRLKQKQEVIFLLDMLSLPVNSFWQAMKRMLVSPTVLKLGFKFKQDLVNLAKSFPGPDAHSCFDKVDPYVDIGKLFLELYGWEDKFVNNLSLATICEEVVGYTLCKDLQCSNWEQRPLTVEQQVYAAADAHCLLVAYDVLQSEALKGQEYSIDCTTTSTKDGIGLLLHDSMAALSHSSCNVLHAHRGIATMMVRVAASLGLLVTAGPQTIHASSNGAAHLIFIQKFGERILLSEEMIKKSARKRSKSGRVKREMQSGVQSFFGLPPWDPSCGGDGTAKFLCDNMVEGLAKQLRNVGIDSVILRTKKSDPRKMLELAEKESRVILTQDAKLLQRRLFPPNLIYHVKSYGKQEQLAEVVRRFNLVILEDNLLSRCTRCNGDFFPNALTPEEALASARGGQTFPKYAINEPVLFWQCSECMHIYWQGKQFYRALHTFQIFAQKVQTSKECSETPMP